MELVFSKTCRGAGTEKTNLVEESELIGVKSHMNFAALRDNLLWITGASSGIGLEMALLAAEAGAKLFLFSSRSEPLEKAAKLCSAKGAMAVHFEVVDLSDCDMAAEAARRALELDGAPQILILNAGISQRSFAIDTELTVTSKLMNLNFLGAVGMARVALTSMIENGGGRFAVTSSLTGVFGFPLRSSYAASKHALHGYFESLELEYGAQGIRVTLAVLGRIRTKIALRALKGDGTRYGNQDSALQVGMDPRRCAAKYWRAILRGRRIKVIGGLEVLMVFFHRYIPALFRLIVRRIDPR